MNPNRVIEIDGREMIVPEVITAGELIKFSGHNPNERMLSQGFSDGTTMECSPERRIFPRNGEKFFYTFRWECEKWVTEHLLFYWIKENKTEFVEKILEESFQEKTIRNIRTKGDISGLIKYKIFEAYQETNDIVYKLLSIGEKKHIETFEDKFRIWAINKLGQERKKGSRDDDDKNDWRITFDHIKITEESLKLFYNFLKIEKKGNDLSETANFAVNSYFKYERKKNIITESLDEEEDEKQNLNLTKQLLKIIEEYKQTIGQDQLDLICHTLRLVDEIMEFNESIINKLFKLIIYYCTKVNLTAKQTYALFLHMSGKTNKTISEICKINESTVSESISAGFNNLRLCLDEM